MRNGNPLFTRRDTNYCGRRRVRPLVFLAPVQAVCCKGRRLAPWVSERLHIKGANYPNRQPGGFQHRSCGLPPACDTSVGALLVSAGNRANLALAHGSAGLVVGSTKREWVCRLLLAGWVAFGANARGKR
ncbi:MAG: hypothetical protein ACFHX7_08020 [Pseudomonadota bacterium]